MLNKINRNNDKLFSRGTNKKAVLILNGFATAIAETDLVFNYFKKKGYTVARPVFRGDRGDKNQKRFGPEEWLAESRAWADELALEFEAIHVVGSSFGSNLGMSLLAIRHKKIKSFTGIEMPVIFNSKFSFLSRVIQPVFLLFKIDRVRKSSVWYRGMKAKLEDGKEEYSYVSVELAGLIRNYINNRTKLELEKVKTPSLIIQAVKSDMLASGNARYILDKLKSKHKEIYYVPVENHDFNLLDEVGKITMLEKIYSFIKEVENSKK
ncbi:MAG: hypothetical protein NT091_02245 [Candidatus Falkowbacteria bacterium]|nr:hypothetical protein [Candidatus Falkowbacteria bacterium]